MLCQLPAPHGPMFVWLEHELHERGAQPWGALREGLRTHASEELALRVMADPQLTTVENEKATIEELRHLVIRMQIEVLETLKDQARAAVGHDPNALQRFQELHARWLTLKTGLAQRLAD